jgi:hypothetical protein
MPFQECIGLSLEQRVDRLSPVGQVNFAREDGGFLDRQTHHEVLEFIDLEEIHARADAQGQCNPAPEKALYEPFVNPVSQRSSPTV